MDRLITSEERDRLIAWEQDPASPEVKIPIPADGYYWPSDECYLQSSGLYEIDAGSVAKCEQSGFVFNFADEED